MGKLRSQFANYYNFMSAGSLAESVAFAAAAGTERNGERNGEGALGGDETINIGNSRSSTVVHSRLGIVADPTVQRLFSLFLDPSEGAKPALPLGNTSNGSQATPSSGVKSLKEELLTFYTGGQITEQQKQMIARCVRMHYNSGDPTAGDPKAGDKK